MKMTSRDYNIIECLEGCGGLTLNQLSCLFFNNSYKSASKRMVTLCRNNITKCQFHYNIGKKVYYINKLPSYHRIVVNSIDILHKGNIKFSQREYSLGDMNIDYLVITNDKKVYCYEVDFYNRTSIDKINKINDRMKDLRPNIVIISRYKRSKLLKNFDNITNILIDDLRVI